MDNASLRAHIEKALKGLEKFLEVVEETTLNVMEFLEELDEKLEGESAPVEDGPVDESDPQYQYKYLLQYGSTYTKQVVGTKAVEEYLFEHPNLLKQIYDETKAERMGEDKDDIKDVRYTPDWTTWSDRKRFF